MPLPIGVARRDALLREGLALEQWQRVVAPAEANKEQAQADLDRLLEEREQVEATLEVATPLASSSSASPSCVRRSPVR